MARRKKVSGPICVWTLDCDPYGGDSWDTDCGQKAVVDEGRPKEHGMNYCWHCGRELKEKVSTR